MTLFNEITIIYGIAILLIAVLSPLFNPFFRFRRDLHLLHLSNQHEDEDTENSDVQQIQTKYETAFSKTNNSQVKGITVLVTAHDQAQDLEKHLPKLLEQEFDGEFQVVVVAEQGDHDTEDVLTRLSNNPHLYATFIPTSSRYMSRKKLSITLGVKAAKYEWIVLLNADSEPASKLWLQHIAKQCNNNAHLVLGYSLYEADTPKHYQVERLYDELYLLHQAAHGTAYRTNSCNLIFRKKAFIKAEGFRGNLQLLRGEYDFIVNKYAEKGTNPICIAPEAWVIEDVPTKRQWRNKHLFAIASRPLLKHSQCIKLLHFMDTFMLHLSYIGIIAAMIYAILTYNWLLTAIAGVALVLTIILRVLSFKAALKFFLPNISVWRVLFYEPTKIWRIMMYKIRYQRANQNDFTSHKL